MGIHLQNIYCEIIIADHHKNENLLSIKQQADVWNIITANPNFFYILVSVDGAMKASWPRNSVSITSTDYLGNFEAHVAFPCIYMNFIYVERLRFDLIYIFGSRIMPSCRIVTGKSSKKWHFISLKVRF